MLEIKVIGYYVVSSGSITNGTAVGWNAGDNSDSDKATYIGDRSGYCRNNVVIKMFILVIDLESLIQVQM